MLAQLQILLSFMEDSLEPISFCPPSLWRGLFIEPTPRSTMLFELKVGSGARNLAELEDFFSNDRAWSPGPRPEGVYIVEASAWTCAH